MTYTLTMPEVGETVTEGTIEKWLKQPGERVEKYEPIVEVNTDKVNVELPSPVSGTVLEHLASEGDTVPVHAPLCTIDEAAGEAAVDAAPPAAQPRRERAETSVPAAARTGAAGGRAPNRATPRVRRLAAELGIDLAAVAGSGPQGRVTEEDVRAAAKEGGRSAPTGAKPAPASVEASAEDETAPLSAIRKTIAQRMSQSAFTAPHAWLVVECDVTGLARLRAAQKDDFRQRHGVDLTYLPFAAHAVSQSLREHPYLNSGWAGDRIVLHKRVHLGVAVATDRGLLVPVVRDADRLSVTGLALAIAELSEKTRANKLSLEDVQGGTFTLDNTGAFGSIVSMPIINLGQAAIMSLEAVRKRPVATADDAIAIRHIVNVCLSFDHRILDGHQAGAFLASVRQRLEAFSPESGLD